MNKKISIIFAVFAIITIGLFFLWLKMPASGTKIKEVDPSAASKNTNNVTEQIETPTQTTPTPTPVEVEISSTADLPETSQEIQPAPNEAVVETAPSPTPPPLNKSDSYLKTSISELDNGQELVSLLVNEEIIRKVVRAVYGLSEGRVVQQFRPIHSPKGTFKAQTMGVKTTEDGQPLYRISRENEQRYASYIAAVSMINNTAFESLYQFYLPTFESAYAELGLTDGNFHSTLIKAIDVILNAPPVDSALILVQPTVAFKYQNSDIEKLPAAHKLMLRMGTENSEALKLELREIKRKLEDLNI